MERIVASDSLDKSLDPGVTPGWGGRRRCKDEEKGARERSARSQSHVITVMRFKGVHTIASSAMSTAEGSAGEQP